MKRMGLGVAFIAAGLVMAASALLGAAEKKGVSIVKTSPTYGEAITRLSGLVVEITFDRPMDPATQDEVTMDQRGATNEKGEPIEFDGTYTWVNPTTLRFKPEGQLRPESVYQVTVWSAKAKDGTELDGAPYRLPFSTRGAQ